MAESGNLSSNGTHPSNPVNVVTYSVLACFGIILCLLGMIGNAIVAWILTFTIKRTKYTVYILNLAIADFIFLLFAAVSFLLMVDNETLLNDMDPNTTLFALEIMYEFGYIAGILFLTAISVERCLSVLFPIWYKCYRPKHLSSFTCGSIWLLGALFSLVDNFVCPAHSFEATTKECTGTQIVIIILTFCIIIPLMLVSGFILIYIIKTSKKSRPPKIYLAIIFTILIFLISVAPVTLFGSLIYFQKITNTMSRLAFFFAITYCTIFNSSANPFIYFLVGRQRKKRFGGSMSRALSRVFKDDETEQTSDGNMTISSLH